MIEEYESDLHRQWEPASDLEGSGAWLMMAEESGSSVYLEVAEAGPDSDEEDPDAIGVNLTVAELEDLRDAVSRAIEFLRAQSR